MHRKYYKKSNALAPAPSRILLDSRLKRCGISLTEHQLNQLWAYHNLLRKRNQDRDLTRLIGFETIVTKHYVDCMIVGNYFELPSPLLDIGTGAGFPGIPLKIRYPNLKLILAEPRPRRVAFLREACALLKLKDVEIFDHKVVSRSFQTKVPAVITRAVETLDKTFLRTSACLDKGGLMIFLKGPGLDEELNEAKKRFPDQFKIILDKAYTLPFSPHRRRLLVLEKKIDSVLSHN